MGYIFGSGTVCAALILALAGSTAATPQASETSGAHATGSVDVTVTNIRNDKGVIRLAICGPQVGFPDCDADALRTATLEIKDATARARFEGIPEGTYAISVFHDANSNNKLDTFLGIPSEGYGFSGNPPFRPRAPRFSEAKIQIQDDANATIKLRYLF